MIPGSPLPLPLGMSKLQWNFQANAFLACAGAGVQTLHFSITIIRWSWLSYHESTMVACFFFTASILVATRKLWSYNFAEAIVHQERASTKYSASKLKLFIWVGGSNRRTVATGRCWPFFLFLSSQQRVQQVPPIGAKLLIFLKIDAWCKV